MTIPTSVDTTIAPPGTRLNLCYVILCYIILHIIELMSIQQSPKYSVISMLTIAIIAKRNHKYKLMIKIMIVTKISETTLLHNNTWNI